MIEEVIVHEVPIALVVLSGKTYVFVHIEGNYVLKGNLARLVLLDKSFVNAERRGARRKTEHEGTVFFMVIDSVGNVVCRPLTHSVVIVLDN
jgi:gamma-glutamyltranspeptidase